MFNGFTNITAPTLNGLDTIDADIVNSSNIVATNTSTTTLTLNGIDVATQITANSNNITSLQQVTTGQTYNSINDTTTFDNHMSISGKLSVMGNILEPTITANTLIITPTEISCLSSIGSNIQTQLNNKVSLTGAETINGIKTFGSVPICATNCSTSSQLANKSYVDGAITTATSGFVTTNSTQNITANKTFYGSSVNIDQGNGTSNGTLKQDFFRTRLECNDTTFSSTTSTGIIVSAVGLDHIIITNGTSPVATNTIAGAQVSSPTLNNYVGYYFYNTASTLASTWNLVSTIGMPVGQISIGGGTTPAIGDYISSNIGTWFVAGTYITGIVSLGVYTISVNALNTTLNKVNLSFERIVLNQASPVAITVAETFTFLEKGDLLLVTKTGTTDIISQQLSFDKNVINVPTTMKNGLTVSSGGCSVIGALNVADTSANSSTLAQSGATLNIQNNVNIGTINLICKDSLPVSRTIMSLSTATVSMWPSTISISQSATPFYIGNGAGTNQSNTFLGTGMPVNVAYTTGENTFLGSGAGTALSSTTANANTLVGYAVSQGLTNGTGNICIGRATAYTLQTGSLNVFIGTNCGFMTGGALSGTGSNNVVIGTSAGNSMVTVAGNNTIVGMNAGQPLTSGSNNICIGFNATLSSAGANNEIAIGTSAETMYIKGGFNYRVSNITGTIGLSFPFFQFYTLSLTGIATITFPTVTSLHTGAVIKFRRNVGAFAVTFQSTAGALIFKAFNSIASAIATAQLPAVNFQTEFVCDGGTWYQITMT